MHVTRAGTVARAPSAADEQDGPTEPNATAKRRPCISCCGKTRLYDARNRWGPDVGAGGQAVTALRGPGMHSSTSPRRVVIIADTGRCCVRRDAWGLLLALRHTESSPQPPTQRTGRGRYDCCPTVRLSPRWTPRFLGRLSLPMTESVAVVVMTGWVLVGLGAVAVYRGLHPAPG